MPQYLWDIRPLTSRPSLTLSIQIIFLTSPVTAFLLGFSWDKYVFICCTSLLLYGSSEVLVVHWSCARRLMLLSHWTWLENWSANIEDTTAADGVLGTSGCMAVNVAAAGVVERLIKIFKLCPNSTVAWRKRTCLGILGLWQRWLCLLCCQKCSFLTPCQT